MELEKRSLRFGAWVIAGALALRLLSNGALAPVVKKLLAPETACVLMFMETGRLVRPVAPQPQPEATQPETTPQDTPAVQQVAFSAEDAQLVQVNSVCGYQVDLQQLLRQPLHWDLTQDGPAVLIVHSHGTESYQKTEDYQESSSYRTLNPDYNVVSVGDRIAQILQAGGVEVIHDRTMHDYPSYTDAYNQSRQSVQNYLTQYPSIRVVLDIHRDAVQTADGAQKGYTTHVAGQAAAQLMMVVGTDASGLSHPNWQENMALAAKLHAQLEKTAPGLCRPISFRSQRFNQDLSAGAMLVEVGAAGNTRAEALLGAQLLAESLLALAHGTSDTVW